MNFLKKLFSRPDYGQMIKDGAKVIDVRSKAEFQSGHARGAINIPLDQIATQITQIKKMGVPIITCCASGMRSGRAKSILKRYEIEAYNGGSWHSFR